MLVTGCDYIHEKQSSNSHPTVTNAYTFVKTTWGHKHRKDDCLLTFLGNLLQEHVNYIMTH